METKKIMAGPLFYLFSLSGSWGLPALAEADYPQHYGWGPGMMGWGLMSWFGPWGMILFWVLIVLLIVWLVKGLGSSKGSTGAVKPAEESALGILKRRYARGEINKEEYLEKKKDLE